MDALVQSELQRATELHEFIAHRIAGRYPSDDRRALFAALMSVAISHHEAILLLVTRERLVSSAFALFRPMIEAGYRGMFVAFLATEEQVETVKAGGDPYGHFNKLAARLDDKFSTDGLYAQYAGEAWGALNGYTHGGMEQLARRIDQDGMIGDHFDPDEVASLLASTASLLTRLVIPFLQVADREQATHAVSLKYLELYPSPTGSD